MKYKIDVLKAGTRTLTDGQGYLKRSFIRDLARQMRYLWDNHDIRFVFVGSGAVAVGRRILDWPLDEDPKSPGFDTRQRIAASVGRR